MLDTISSPARLSVDDLSALSDEASRMRISLACLIGALEDGEPILWCDEGALPERMGA